MHQMGAEKMPVGGEIVSGLSYDRPFRSTVLLFTQSSRNAKVFSLESTLKNYD